MATWGDRRLQKRDSLANASATRSRSPHSTGNSPASPASAPTPDASMSADLTHSPAHLHILQRMLERDLEAEEGIQKLTPADAKSQSRWIIHSETGATFHAQQRVSRAMKDADNLILEISKTLSSLGSDHNRRTPPRTRLTRDEEPSTNSARPRQGYTQQTASSACKIRRKRSDRVQDSKLPLRVPSSDMTTKYTSLQTSPARAPPRKHECRTEILDPQVRTLDFSQADTSSATSDTQLKLKGVPAYTFASTATTAAISEPSATDEDGFAHEDKAAAITSVVGISSQSVDMLETPPARASVAGDRVQGNAPDGEAAKAMPASTLNSMMLDELNKTRAQLATVEQEREREKQKAVLAAIERQAESAQWQAHATRVFETYLINRERMARQGSGTATACGIGVTLSQESPSAPVRISAVSDLMHDETAVSSDGQAGGEVAVGDVVLAIDGKALSDVALAPALCRGAQGTSVVLLLGSPHGLARNSVTLVRRPKTVKFLSS